MHRLSCSALVLALAACTSATDVEGFPEDLTERGGCADIQLFAHDEADTMLLDVRGDGFVAAAEDAGEETTFDLALADGELEVRLEVGERISDLACDDAVEVPGRQVDHTWEAIGGAATLTVVPGGDEDTPGASLWLEDVDLVDDAGTSLFLEAYAIEDVAVGWLPG